MDKHMDWYGGRASVGYVARNKGTRTRYRPPGSSSLLYLSCLVGACMRRQLQLAFKHVASTCEVFVGPQVSPRVPLRPAATATITGEVLTSRCLRIAALGRKPAQYDDNN